MTRWSIINFETLFIISTTKMLDLLQRAWIQLKWKTLSITIGQMSHSRKNNLQTDAILLNERIHDELSPQSEAIQWRRPTLVERGYSQAACGFAYEHFVQLFFNEQLYFSHRSGRILNLWAVIFTTTLRVASTEYWLYLLLLRHLRHCCCCCCCRRPWKSLQSLVLRPPRISPSFACRIL